MVILGIIGYQTYLVELRLKGFYLLLKVEGLIFVVLFGLFQLLCQRVLLGKLLLQVLILLHCLLVVSKEPFKLSLHL